jgi:hypothetical protein
MFFSTDPESYIPLSIHWNHERSPDTNPDFDWGMNRPSYRRVYPYKGVNNSNISFTILIYIWIALNSSVGPALFSMDIPEQTEQIDPVVIENCKIAVKR